MRFFLLALIIVFLLSAPVFSIQSKNKPWRSLTHPQLEEKIKTEKNRKDHIDLLNFLAYKLSYFEHNSAKKYAKEALKNAEEITPNQKYEMGIVDALNNLGLIYIQIGDLEKAKSQYDKAKEKARNFNYKVGEAESYIGLYRYYQLKGQYETAFSRLLKSQVILDGLKKDDEGLQERANANRLYGLGVIYFYDKDSNDNKDNYEIAYNYFLESLQLREKAGDQDEIGMTFYSLGEALQEQEKFEEAEEYFRKAVAIGKSINNNYIIANVQQSMGDIALKKHKNSSEALKNYKYSLEKFEIIGDQFQIATQNRDIGILLVEQKKHEEAESYLLESLNRARKIENAHTIYSVAKNLTTVYDKLGKIAKKNEYAKLAEKQKKLLDEFSMPTIYEKIIQTQKSASQRTLLQIILVISLIFAAIVTLFYVKAKHANKNLAKSLKDLQLLDFIGKDIISSLTVEEIIDKVYQSVNNIMDATVFGICIYKPEQKALDVSYKEKGENLPEFYFYLEEKERMAVYCFERQEKIRTEDYRIEYKKYSSTKPIPKEGETFLSHIFLPLTLSLDENKTKRIGVLTVQSPKVKSYTDYHVMMLENIGNYAAIALDNAAALKKIAEQALSLEKEKELGRLKDEFTYTLSHQYKTPLTTIDLACQYLRKYLPNVTEEEIRGRVLRITANVNRLKIIHDKLMEHSKPLKPDFHNLEKICMDTVKEFKEQKVSGHNIDFISSSIIPKAFIDKELVKIMLENLLSNSLKYSKESTTISVNLEEQGNNAIIKVTDQGRGIPQDYLNLKDKRFHRGDNVSDTEGTGLGLSIVEHYVKLHGGSIHYSSHLNEGTTITIALPINNQKLRHKPNDRRKP